MDRINVRPVMERFIIAVTEIMVSVHPGIESLIRDVEEDNW